MVGNFKPQFRGGDQQDAHEFLTDLMELLHLELHTLDLHADANLLAPDSAWVQQMEFKESFVGQLFFGQLTRSKICLDCFTETSFYEQFSILSLVLPKKKVNCRIEVSFE